MYSLLLDYQQGLSAYLSISSLITQDPSKRYQAILESKLIEWVSTKLDDETFDDLKVCIIDLHVITTLFWSQSSSFLLLHKLTKKMRGVFNKEVFMAVNVNEMEGFVTLSLSHIPGVLIRFGRKAWLAIPSSVKKR